MFSQDSMFVLVKNITMRLFGVLMALAYAVFGVYVLPGATVSLAIEPPSGDGDYAVAARSGTLTRLRSDGWQWQAPNEPGLYEVMVRATATSERMRLNLFVMVPRDRMTHGQLNNYPIGQYPTEPLRDLPIYLPPAGFIEVTPDHGPYVHVDARGWKARW